MYRRYSLFRKHRHNLQDAESNALAEPAENEVTQQTLFHPTCRRNSNVVNHHAPANAAPYDWQKSPTKTSPRDNQWDSTRGATWCHSFISPEPYRNTLLRESPTLKFCTHAFFTFAYEDVGKVTQVSNAGSRQRLGARISKF